MSVALVVMSVLSLLILIICVCIDQSSLRFINCIDCFKGHLS